MAGPKKSPGILTGAPLAVCARDAGQELAKIWGVASSARQRPLRQSWRAIDRAKTKAGRKRISSAQKQRWNTYRETKKAEAEKIN